jgi:hypothetical protein
MGVPNSEVGYTTAMPRREDHEVHKDMWWHWIKEPDVSGFVRHSIIHIKNPTRCHSVSKFILYLYEA